MSKVREGLEKSKNGDGSVLRTHAEGGMHGWVAKRMVRCAEKMVGSDLSPKYGRSGSPHNTSNNTCAPSQLPYMVWLVGWLGGRPIRPGFIIGVAISGLGPRAHQGAARCGMRWYEAVRVGHSGHRWSQNRRPKRARTCLFWQDYCLLWQLKGNFAASHGCHRWSQRSQMVPDGPRWSQVVTVGHRIGEGWVRPWAQPPRK